MKIIADNYNYQFYGILLPVNKNDDIFETYQKEFDFINEYNYLYCFNDVFDQEAGNPYTDYCHIKCEYPHIIAFKVFEIIKESINF